MLRGKQIIFNQELKIPIFAWQFVLFEPGQHHVQTFYFAGCLPNALAHNFAVKFQCKFIFFLPQFMAAE